MGGVIPRGSCVTCFHKQFISCSESKLHMTPLGSILPFPYVNLQVSFRGNVPPTDENLSTTLVGKKKQKT